MACICAVLLASCACAAPSGSDKVLRVGWYLVPGVQTCDVQSVGAGSRMVYSGYNYEYLQRIAEFTGWKYVFVKSSFKDCCEMLAKGEIDLLGDVARVGDRGSLFIFPDNECGSSGLSLVTLASNDKYDFNGFSGFSGIRIGAVAGSNMVKILPLLSRKKNFTPVVKTFSTNADVRLALKKGEVDAIMVSSLASMKGFKILARTESQKFYFAVSPKRPELARQLDDAISLIKYYQPDYDNILAAKYCPDRLRDSASFTRAERKYIARRKASGVPVLVCYDPAWIPAEYRDPKTGQMSGIMAQVFERIASVTGLSFKFVTAGSYADATRRYDGKAEVGSTLSTDYEWAEQHGAWITQPVFSVPIFVLFQPDRIDYDVVALPRGYHLAKAVLARCREEEERRKVRLKYIYFDTMDQCMDAVKRRKAGRTYINFYELNYYSSRRRFDGLGVQGVPGFSEPTSIAVYKRADPMLFHVISRALRSIPASVINDIIVSTANEPAPLTVNAIFYAHPFASSAAASAAAILLFLTVFFYYSSRKNERQRRLLEAASNAKSEFLSRMSHDIRTPMNAVVGLTEIAARENRDARIGEYLDKIRYSSRFLLDLINNILDLSKIESGSFALSPEPYSLKEFAAVIDSSVGEQARAKGLRFVSRMPSDVDCVAVDKLRFNQVFINLLGNAVKFTPVGGEVKLELEAETVKEGIVRLRGTVSDTGVGVSPDFVSRLFSPFEQEDASHTGDIQGTGLGLSIVKKIVDAAGGKISVQSEKGRGTVFAVEAQVPVCEEQQRSEEHNVDKVYSSLKGRRVLVAEDNEINQEVVCTLLKNEGAICDVASDGSEALSMFAASPENYYDAVLMDMRMPVMDGMEATRRLRSLARADAVSVPVIALTADAYSETKDKIMQCGMTAYLSKPVYPEELCKTLEKVIEKQS